MKKNIPIIVLSSAIAGAGVSYFVFKQIQKSYFYIKSYDKKFEMKFSNKWHVSKEKNELNENSNLELINNKDSLCFIMFSKNKTEVNNITLEEYNQNTVNGIRENNIILSSNKIAIHKKNVYITEFYSNYKDVDVHYSIYVLETNNYYHQFMIASMSGKNYYSKIKNILSTLKEI
ncbi:hypothetical protein [uncultured Brachyspira sp.]|uniref:hypothetical protein n=1 Tax=uncultured Brachyspira sp. TaxID=221953 RepID=UPI0025F068CF|nr:hypothetical protein [uncultured Brachyspira sp.]